MVQEDDLKHHTNQNRKTGEKMKENFTIGKAIDPGIKRQKKPNQDSIGWVEADDRKGIAPLLILADGMGGYSGGEIASATVVETVKKVYTQKADRNANYSELLLDCIQQAHSKIIEKADKDEKISRMGSTIVLTALFPSHVQIANVGDSRAYLITASGEIRQISYDHSFVMDQVRNGLITKEEALRHPKKNVLTMSLSGLRPEIEPYIAEEPWSEGDYVLICSDGLWGSVSEAQISNIVTSLDPQSAADKLIKMANIDQGPDNISILIARNGRNKAIHQELKDAVTADEMTTEDVLAIVEADNNRKARRKILILIALILLIIAAVLWLIHSGILILPKQLNTILL